MSQGTLTALAPAIVHAGQGQTVRAFGAAIEFMLTAQNTGGLFAIGLATIPPGGGPPAHTQAEDEVFLVLEGRYSFLTDGRWTEAGPGAVVFIPRGAPHTFRNVGDTPARHWVINTPAGFERFFAQAEALFAEPGGPDPARIVALTAEHGGRFV